MRIYCDTSALGVEFNDLETKKNRVEASAMVLVFGLSQFNDWEFVESWQHHIEIDDTEPRSRQNALRAKLRGSSYYVRSTEAWPRVRTLMGMGFSIKDAGHLAAALESECDVLLTCDGEFHDLARQNAKLVPLRVLRPSEFMAEVRYGG